MFPNAKPSEIVSLLATLDPVSQAAATVTTGWLNAADHHSFMVALQTGVMGASATIDAKIQQASDSSGTGVKDLSPAKAIAQILKASGDNKQALLNFRGQDLDVANGFGWFRLSVTVGTAASLIAAQVYGFNPRFADASAFNQAGVVQNV